MPKYNSITGQNNRGEHYFKILLNQNPQEFKMADVQEKWYH